MKIKCRCKHCHRLFIPNPRVIDQQYCSQKVCQRARKRHWQRQKMKTDPDYRQNQKESQKKMATRQSRLLAKLSQKKSQIL